MQSDAIGWTWIAEIEPHRFQWTRVTERHRRPEQNWVPPCLKNLESEGSRGADVSWRMAKTVAGPGYYIVGDAAAMLDPSSSHGVLRAMMSGMMAAHLIIQQLCAGVNAEQCTQYFQEWLTRWFDEDSSRMRRFYHAANLFGFNTDATEILP